MPREGSPRAMASLPCSRQRSDSRAGSSRSRPRADGPAPRSPADVVLKEPGFGERTPQLNLFVAVQAGLAKRPNQERRGVGAQSALQRLNRLSVRVRP